jgi:ketosteroid isomerase-like protein
MKASAHVRVLVALVLALSGLVAGCGASTASHREGAAIATDHTRGEEETAVRAVLDAWHEAAARSDETAYFDLMTPDSVFLGTDATERWSREQFRAYAHEPFAAGRGWRMRAVRREVVIEPGPVALGSLAWFDEDLETVNLGPARGSGVLVRTELGWRIAHYNLTITVPNERFGEVRALLAAPARGAAQEPAR